MANAIKAVVKTVSRTVDRAGSLEESSDAAPKQPRSRKPRVSSNTNANAVTTDIVALAGRPTERRQRRAAEILEAAREVFLDKGFERASISEIAARVGVVEGLVYTYFPTKRDLLNEVLRRLYEPLLIDVESGFSRLKGVRGKLRFLIWRHMRVYIEDPGLARLVLHEVRTGSEYFTSGLHAMHVAYTQYVGRAIRDAIADGEVPADVEPEMVRAMLYGGLEHLLWPILYGRGRIDANLAADRYVDLLMGGMLGGLTSSTATSAAAPSAHGARGDVDLLNRRLERLERLAAAADPQFLSAAKAKRK